MERIKIGKKNEKEVPDWLWVLLITFFVCVPIFGWLGRANTQGTIVFGGGLMLTIFVVVYLVMLPFVAIGYAIFKVVKGGR